MSEWVKQQFKELFSIPLKNGLTKPSRVRGSGLRMVNMKEIFGFDVINDLTPMELVPVTKKERSSLLEYDDLLFARQSLVESGAGKISIFKGKGETVFESHLIRCRMDKKKAFPDFIYYLFKSPIGRGTVSSIVEQTAAAGIRGSDLKNLKFVFPPLSEQKAIASVLSSLDDKIDLLHRQNKTLEAMAETLFRQWFIEAQPQPSPNLSQRARDMEAQEDWEERPLDEVAEYLNGLACQKYPPKNDVDKLPVLKIKELRNGFTDNSDWATTDVKEDYIVQSGDIIFSWSGSLLVKIWDGRKCVLNQHLFKVTSDTYPKWFIYHWTKFHLEKFIAIAESKATTMGHIKRKDLSHSMVLVPTEKELEHMNSIIYPLIDKIILNNEQLIKLGILQDTLLPKLMSGEARMIY